MEKVRPITTDLSIHIQDLKEAIYYLPESFNQEQLFKALKGVYEDNKGKELAIEYLHKRHLTIPTSFDEKWKESTLTAYQEHDLDGFLTKNIYEIAKEAGWRPKAFRKGKNTKRPPSKRSMAKVEKELNAKEGLEVNLNIIKERTLSEEEKSFIPPQVMNINGACYDHPYMKKSDIPEREKDYLEKLDKIVDCEVKVIEAIETLIEQPEQIEDDKEVKYRIHLNNNSGKSSLPIATYEDLTTMNRFSSFLVSKGFVKFLGNHAQFDKFHKFLINGQDYPTVTQVSSWGEYKPKKFLFQNGLYDVKVNQFFPADDNDRIHYKDKIIVCPTTSELVRPPKLSVPDNIEGSKQFLAEKFTLWETFNGRLNVRSTLGYAIACFFSQRIVEEDTGFPLLFKFGERGTGKSSSMDWFMALFGYPSGSRQSVTKQNTLKGMTRNMTLSRTFPFFLDDYRTHENNGQTQDLTSLILNWFHQIGTSMAMKTTDHRTKGTPMKAAIVMTGNDKPGDPAVLSRLLILNYNRFVKKEELERIPEITQNTHRFSEFTYHVLSVYDMINNMFFAYVKQNKKWLANQGFDGRTVNNWSYILAGIQCVPVILHPLETWQNEFESLRSDICNSIRNEEALQKEVNPLHEFFDVIQHYAMQINDRNSEFPNKTNVLDHRHFRCKVTNTTLSKTGEVYTGYVLYLSLNRIWQTLQSVNATITRETTLNMIETKLQNSSYYIEHGVQIPLTKALGEQKESNLRCYALNAQQLVKNHKLEELIEKANEYERNRPLRVR